MTIIKKQSVKPLDNILNLPFTKMMKIPEGNFIMGSNDNFSWEKPEHPVHIPSFYIGQYQVTQALWEKVMGNNPSRFKGKNRPVERVSWNDIREKNGFLDKLNSMTDFGGVFRLPIESEWEYAAKANENFKYAGSNNLEEVGWYDDNSHYETKPVGLKNPNNFGLYDMSGNIWEWCKDKWHSDYENAPNDGTAWIDGTDSLNRVYRGGSYFFGADGCRSTFRSDDHPTFRGYDVGFRLVFQVQ